MFHKKDKKRKAMPERRLDRRRKKTLSQRMANVTYMQASLTLFGLSLVPFGVGLWRAVATAGTAGVLIALPGFSSFFAALAGFLVTIYGHFVVRIEGKIKWIAGITANGMMLVILVLLYLAGL